MEKIIFVGGGHGRSGTNIMKRLLCMHPHVSWVLGDETRLMEFISDLLPKIRYDGDYYLPRRASTQFVTFCQSVLKRFGDDAEVRGALTVLEAQLSCLTTIIPRFGTLPLISSVVDAELPSIFSMFTHRLFAAKMLNPQARFACEKTPSNAQYINLTHTLVPTSQMVVMLRHPIDTALSFLPHDWGPDDPIEAAHYTHAYLSRWRAVSNQVPTSYYLAVKLDEMIEDPPMRLKEVFNFLGIEIDPNSEVIIKAAQLLRPSISRRGTVSPQTLRRMAHIMAEDLDAFGYVM